MYTSLDKLVEFYLNNTTNLRPLISAHYVISYPQNGDRIVTIDTATSPYVLVFIEPLSLRDVANKNQQQLMQKFTM